MALTKVTYGLLSADTSAIDLNIDANTLYVDSSANRVGIGTNSPQVKFHANSGTTDEVARFESSDQFADIQLKDSGGASHIRSSNGSLILEADRANAVSSSAFLINVDNSEALRIISSGNVGIVTSSPSDKLTVSGSVTSSSSSFIEHKVDQTDSGHIRMGISSGTAEGFLIAGNTGSSHVSSAPSLKFMLDTDGGSLVEEMRLTSTGLGIGTTSPNTTLSVVGSSANGIELGQTTSATTDSQRLFFSTSSGSNSIRSRSGALLFSTGATAGSASGTERMRISSSGNVSIGTTTASGLLNVDGTLHYGGQLRVNDASHDGSASAPHLCVGYDNDTGFFRPATNTIGITTTGSERMRIDSSGKVGIGETSPLGKLHVKSADSGGSADSGADELVIEGSGDSGIQILSGTSDYGTILFGDSGDSAAGRLRYEHNNNALNFGTNGSWNRLYINSSGKVGIATTSPSAQLSVVGNSLTNVSTTGIPAIRAQGGYGGGIGLLDTKESGWYAQDNGDTLYQYVGRTVGSDTPASKVIMTYKSSGNVGIGETNPSKLGLTGSSVGKVLHMGGDDCQIRLANSILHHDNSGNTTLHLRNHYGATSSYARTKIESGFTTFHTGTSFAERMRISSSGDVIISDSGRITQGSNLGTSGGTGGYQLNIDNNAVRMNWYNDAGATRTVQYFYYQGVERGSIQVLAGSTSYLTSSDYRLKQNEIAVWDGTTILKQLTPYKFNWRADPTGEAVQGFFAHEVSSLVPDAISGTKDEVDSEGNPKYQGIDHSKLVPLLVKTIQELEARITELESK
jgi:hypothetical protein